MAQYKCEACNYVYNEMKGDSWSDVPAGTRFIDLPDEWVCPVCFATQAMFSRFSDEEFIKDFFKNLDNMRIRQTYGYA